MQSMRGKYALSFGDETALHLLRRDVNFMHGTDPTYDSA
jgi:hypothetical protein